MAASCTFISFGRTLVDAHKKHSKVLASSISLTMTILYTPRATVEDLADDMPTTKPDAKAKIRSVLAALQCRGDDLEKTFIPTLKALSSLSGFAFWWKHDLLLTAMNELLKEMHIRVIIDKNGEANYLLTPSGRAAADYEPATTNEEFHVLLKAMLKYYIVDENDIVESDTDDDDDTAEENDSEDDGDDENNENGRRVLRRLN